MVRFAEGVGVGVEVGVWDDSEELLVMVEFAGVDVDCAETRRRDEKRRDKKAQTRTGAGLIVGREGREGTCERGREEG